MSKKILGALLVVIAVIATSGLFFPQGGTVIEQVLGVAAGPDVTERWSFRNGFSQGGSVATTSGVATYTITAADLAGTPSFIAWNPSINPTLSIGATSTFRYVPNVGDSASFYFLNASTSVGEQAKITFAAVGDGTDLQTSTTTTGASDLILNARDTARFTLLRRASGIVTVIIEEMGEAD